MGLRDRLVKALGGMPAGQQRVEPRMEGNSMIVGDLSDERIQDFLRGGVESASGAHVSASRAMKIAVANRCVNIICGLMATYPRDVMRRVDEKRRAPAVGHPLRDVLTVKPNRWQTPSEFIRMMQANLLLHGCMAAQKVKSIGRVIALNPLDVRRLQTKQLDDLTLQHQYTRKDGNVVTLAQDDVFYAVGLSLDGVTPMSVLSYARESMGLSIQTERAAGRLMKNGNFSQLVIEKPTGCSHEVHERLKNDLDELAGPESAGKPLLLEEGMKLSKESVFSAKDLQFLELKDFSRTEVGMFFGVPPHLYGDTSKATSWGSGIEQQNIAFLQYTMQNWITLWEEAIQRDLLGDPKLFFRFDVRGMLRTDLKTQSEAFGRMLGSGGSQGWRSVNEVRSLDDVEPSNDPNDDKIPGPTNQAKDNANAS